MFLWVFRAQNKPQISDVEQLTGMGYSESRAKNALRFGDLEAALNLLLEYVSIHVPNPT